MKQSDSQNKAPASPGRRDFLKKTGRFAAATPPAVVFLLSTSLASEAVARSGGGAKGPIKKLIDLLFGR
ncbi:MAG: hypothetical protein ACOH2H_23200 [Cypionkella sp.]